MNLHAAFTVRNSKIFWGVGLALSQNPIPSTPDGLSIRRFADFSNSLLKN
jgi:hypothetical protein